MKTIVHAFLNRRHERVEKERQEQKREDEEAETNQSEDQEEDEKGNPGDTGVGDEEHKGVEADEGEHISFLILGVGEEKEVKCPDGNHGEEVKTENIGVAEGAVNSRDAYGGVLEADAEKELVDTDEDREEGGDEKSFKEGFEVFVGFDFQKGDSRKGKDVEDAQELFDSSVGVDREEEGECAPGQDYEEGAGVREGGKVSGTCSKEENTKHEDQHTNNLGEG